MLKRIVVENYRLANGMWAKYREDDTNKYFTKSYAAWSCIKARCGAAIQKKRAVYAGCVMHPDFLDFQKFVEWHIRQIGFDSGYAIDKDILSPGNRVYGPDTCVLVPRGFNSFCALKRDKGLPPGVMRSKKEGRYRAILKSDCKQIRLGTFDSIEEAAEAYRKAKREEEFKWIEKFTTPFLKVDERVVEVLRRGRDYSARNPAFEILSTSSS